MTKNNPPPPKADAPKADDPSTPGADPAAPPSPGADPKDPPPPPPKADADCYICVDPVRHNGKDYTGEIKLSPDDAAPLLAMGAITPV